MRPPSGPAPSTGGGGRWSNHTPRDVARRGPIRLHRRRPVGGPRRRRSTGREPVLVARDRLDRGGVLAEQDRQVLAHPVAQDDRAERLAEERVGPDLDLRVATSRSPPARRRSRPRRAAASAPSEPWRTTTWTAQRRTGGASNPTIVLWASSGSSSQPAHVLAFSLSWFFQRRATGARWPPPTDDPDPALERAGELLRGVRGDRDRGTVRRAAAVGGGGRRQQLGARGVAVDDAGGGQHARGRSRSTSRARRAAGHRPAARRGRRPSRPARPARRPT